MAIVKNVKSNVSDDVLSFFPDIQALPDAGDFGDNYSGLNPPRGISDLIEQALDFRLPEVTEQASQLLADVNLLFDGSVFAEGFAPPPAGSPAGLLATPSDRPINNYFRYFLSGDRNDASAGFLEVRGVRMPGFKVTAPVVIPAVVDEFGVVVTPEEVVEPGTSGFVDSFSPYVINSVTLQNDVRGQSLKLVGAITVRPYRVGSEIYNQAAINIKSLTFTDRDTGFSASVLGNLLITQGRFTGVDFDGNDTFAPTRFSGALTGLNLSIRDIDNLPINLQLLGSFTGSAIRYNTLTVTKNTTSAPTSPRTTLFEATAINGIFNGDRPADLRGNPLRDYTGTEGDRLRYLFRASDRIEGTTESDLLLGYDGNDTIIGGLGDDTLNGMAGNDSVQGDQGADAIGGGAGNDILLGDGTVAGANGDDAIVGGSGFDTINGGAGNDLLQGDGDFFITASDGPDFSLFNGGGGFTIPTETSPTISISSDQFEVFSGQGVTIRFNLSAPSTDFTFSDVFVTGGSLTNFAGAGTSYTATFTPNTFGGDGGFTAISVGSGAFTNSNGNFNQDGSDFDNSLRLEANTQNRYALTIPGAVGYIYDPGSTEAIDGRSRYADTFVIATGGGRDTITDLGGRPLSAEDRANRFTTPRDVFPGLEEPVEVGLPDVVTIAAGASMVGFIYQDFLAPYPGDTEKLFFSQEIVDFLNQATGFRPYGGWTPTAATSHAGTSATLYNYGSTVDLTAVTGTGGWRVITLPWLSYENGFNNSEGYRFEGYDVRFLREADPATLPTDSALYGSAHLTGSNSNDTLMGGGSDDKLMGGNGNDSLEGFEGDDWLAGGAGNDTLLGGSGLDTLVGNAGADRLTGGLDRDTFRFEGPADVSPTAAVVITDFTAGATDQGDVLSLNGSAAPGFAFVPAGAGSPPPPVGVMFALRPTAGGAFPIDSNVVVITSTAAGAAITGAITSASAATAIGNATSPYAVGQKVLFVVANATDSAVFLFTSAAADNTVTAAELGAGPIVTLAGLGAGAAAGLQSTNFDFSNLLSAPA